jgi:superfamily II DNA or RNA helicase
VLILAPLSVVDNWVKEFANFAPSLRIGKFHGANRDLIRDSLANRQIQICITSYETILKDFDFLGKIKWSVLVVDEAHRLKNHKSMLYTTLESKFTFDFSLLLTGTPIQNNMTELWALLHFIRPDLFGSLENFLEWFPESKFSTKGDVESKQLLSIFKPFILRRNKDVLSDLPTKKEYILYSSLTAMQKKYYIGVLKKDSQVLGKSASRSLLNVIMSLRKCCNHPYLFQGAEPEPFEEGDHLITNASKMQILDKLLDKLYKEKRKVLIFSQMTSMLDILQDYLHFKKYSYERIDGSVRAEERSNAITSFSDKNDVFVFLLSTRSGGVGLNLTSACAVIFYDLDFNPQMDRQAQERVYRIGQKRDVDIYRIIVRDTVEEIMFTRASRKLKLSHNIIESGELNEKSLLEGENMLDIVKYGLYKLVNEDSTNVEFDLGEALKTGEIVVHDDIVASVPSSMYEFEGTDYKKPGVTQEKIVVVDDDLDQLKKLTEELNPITPLPKRRFVTIPDQNLRKVPQQQKKRKYIGDYQPCRIIVDDEEELNSDFEDAEPIPINYVIGDVTSPTHGKNPKFIVNCCSNVGVWGRGGLFDAINRISMKPQENYEEAKRNHDLKLGDANLVQINENIYVINCIVQKKDKNSKIGITGILLKELEDCLNVIAWKAKQYGATIHMPRIGHGLPKFNWYGVERVIKKCFADMGIQTYVYYYKKALMTKFDVFDGMSIGLYELGDDEKDCKKKIMAHGGIIVQLPCDTVDIIVCGKNALDDHLVKQQYENPGLHIFSEDWIDACIQQNMIILNETYVIKSDVSEKMIPDLDEEDFY